MKTMIKNLILGVILCFLALTSFAQIPNPSFEEINANGSLRNWGNLYIQSVWFDTTGEMQGDSIIYDNAYYAATSEAHNGYWAAHGLCHCLPDGQHDVRVLLHLVQV